MVIGEAELAPSQAGRANRSEVFKVPWQGQAPFRAVAEDSEVIRAAGEAVPVGVAREAVVRTLLACHE